MDRILELPLRSVTRLIQEKSVDILELTKACIARAKKFNDLNALVEITEMKALTQAERSSKRQRNNARISAVDGVPIVVKDNFCIRDTKTTCASKMLENFDSPYDATVYKRLEGAGAVLIGKSNLDQFGMGSGTVDSLYGPTKNIWGYRGPSHDFHVAGGSSGGSAVAVATHICYG